MSEDEELRKTGGRGKLGREGVSQDVSLENKKIFLRGEKRKQMSL